MNNEELENQLKVLESSVSEDTRVIVTIREFTKTLRMFYEYIKDVR